MSFALKNLTFSYTSAEGGPVLALQGVSAELPDDEVIAILGPSGCGKTTLLNLLALLLENQLAKEQIVYSSGAVRKSMDYHDLAKEPDPRSRLRREEFGVVLQSCYLLPHFTNLQNVCMPLALLGWPLEDRQLWAETLIKTADALSHHPGNDRPGGDLWASREKMPREVSLGQKQRMAVLRAIVHNPHVVFADEPISNLDRANTYAVLKLLLDWQKGNLHSDVKNLLGTTSLSDGLRRRLENGSQDSRPRTLIMVCHHIDIAMQVADRVLVFDEHHCLAGTFTREQGSDLAACLDRVLAVDSLEGIVR